jgi:hypothetical protein
MTGTDRSGASRRTPESAERLVRSLVGVAAASVAAAPDGSIQAVTVTPEPGASERQVIQNVTSALLAGLGIALAPGRIVVGPQLAAQAPAPAPPAEIEPRAAEPAVAPGPRVLRAADDDGLAPAAAADVKEPDPGTSPYGAPPRIHRPGRTGAGALARPAAFRNAKIRPHAGAVALAAVDDPMPEVVRQPSLDSIELQRVDAQLRCRVVLSVGAERFISVAEALDLPGAALELPARAAADALRAARAAPPIQFEGATFAEVRGQLHVVAALRVWTGTEFIPAAGAAAVTASIEEAAARAVIQAVTVRS